jgi:hypothetical protein
MPSSKRKPVSMTTTKKQKTKKMIWAMDLAPKHTPMISTRSRSVLS